MATAKQQELTAVLDDLAAIEAEEAAVLAELEAEKAKRLAEIEQRRKATAEAAVNHTQAAAFFKLCVDSGKFSHLLPKSSRTSGGTSSGGTSSGGSRANAYYLKHTGTGKVLDSDALGFARLPKSDESAKLWLVGAKYEKELGDKPQEWILIHAESGKEVNEGWHVGYRAK